jgi:hypothetical protein
MKRIIALAIALIALPAVAVFAGQPEVSSKEVIVAPTPAPTPESYFRPNEFDIGAFATYVTGTGSGNSTSRTFNEANGFENGNGSTLTLSSNGSSNGWGGGMDFTYWFGWKYVGLRFQGAAVDLSSPTVTATFFNAKTGVTSSRSASTNSVSGIVTGDLLLRLPLDDFWPSIHLAPYLIGGGGGLFTGAGGSTINTRFAGVNNAVNNVSANVTNNRGLGHLGGGLEYRFTPHVGLFGEATYNWIGGGSHSSGNDFIQTNFGLRYAF